MYFKTLEEEQTFLHMLWNTFNNWAFSKRGNEDPGTEIIECDLKCPKCGDGKIVHYGRISIDRSGHNCYGMRHFCSQCGEEFDRTVIGEDIYNNTPHEILDKLDTPLGYFQVLRNSEQIPFRYRTTVEYIDGMEIVKHIIDIDTSEMKKGDKVFAGIIGARFEHIDSDEQCSFRAAENDEWYLVINGEDINDYEVDTEDFTFVTDYEDENGFYYLIHQDPDNLKNQIARAHREIFLSVAWEKKALCENYEDVIENAVW